MLDVDLNLTKLAFLHGYILKSAGNYATGFLEKRLASAIVIPYESTRHREFRIILTDLSRLE